MKLTKNQEATSADKQSIGFDYQFLYFIYRALQLKPKEKIGYEVKDDVHLELENGNEVFIQLKHSTQSNKDSSIINMTEKDVDLWKTLYNWNLSINEHAKKDKIEYISNIEFLLVTNKNNKKNKFFIETEKLKNKLIKIEDYKNYILELYKSIEGETNYSKNLKKYMRVILEQEDNLLNLFVNKLNFTLGFDDLVKKIKDQILSNHIDERKLDEIFERCIGNLSIWKYENIKKNEKVFISFEDIDKRIKNCFIYGRNREFPRVLKQKIFLPDKLEEQNFIKELIEIDYLEDMTQVEFAKYTTIKLKIENLLESWIQENYLTESDKDEFLNQCISLWANYHRQAHKESKKAIRKGVVLGEELQELLYDNAINCLYEIKKLFLNLYGENLSIDESNGTFYYLSDQLEIGWKLDWEKRYR